MLPETKHKFITRAGVELAVVYKFYPAVSGIREKGTGVPLEPDSPAEITIIQIWIERTDVTHLLEDFHDDIAEELLTGEVL